MTDIEKQLDSIQWCAQPWALPQVSEEARRELLACRDVTPPEPTATLQELIDASKRFPVPFPIHTVRLEKLKASTPPERLLRNAASTYPLVHERVLLLMANFLIYKRKYGSRVEQALYRDMSVPQLVDRILQKRAVTFMKAQDQYKLLTGEKGHMGIPQLVDRILRKRAVTFVKAQDQYKLLTREKGTDGWESVGTDSEKPPLVLSNVLSYDEIKISALVCVSGYTECINDGTRKNSGVPKRDGVEREAVIIGVIGPRFKRVNRMEYEDIVVSEQQNTAYNGYGPNAQANDAKTEWRRLWADFYQVPSITWSEVPSHLVTPCTGARVFSSRWARVKAGAFDNTTYYRRMELLFDVSMIEADTRARDAGKMAFLNIIGAGLGVWKMSPHQLDIFVLSLIHRARSLIAAGRLRHVAVVNLAYIAPGKQVMALFKTSRQNSGSGDDDGEEAPKVLFLKDDSHPRGGIKIQLQSRQPSSELKGEHRGMLLLLTYPWDGNAHPGNEFWLGKLTTSGDPAAACSTQVSELHNAHVNPAVSGTNTRIAADTVRSLREHCQIMANA